MGSRTTKKAKMSSYKLSCKENENYPALHSSCTRPARWPRGNLVIVSRAPRIRRPAGKQSYSGSPVTRSLMGPEKFAGHKNLCKATE